MGPNYSGGNFAPSNYGYYNAPKKRVSKLLLLAIFGGVILLFVIIAIISTVVNSDNIGTQEKHLSVRLTNLSTLTAGAAKQLHSDSLQKINAETDIITDGVQANLATALPKKVDKSVIADESDATDTTNLANAALTGTYDSQYKQVLQAKLESISALMSEMYTKTKSKSLKATLLTDYNNYQALLKSLSDITL